MRHSIAIQPSGTSTAGKTGKLFDCTLVNAVTKRMDQGPGGQHLFEKIEGLALNLCKGDAARIRLISGAPYGGAELTRVFTLTPQGVWMVAAGWANASVFVDAVGDDTAGTGTVVGYTWTSHPPRPPSLLRLVETVAITGAAGVAIPEGAIQIATAVADPGWVWLTDQDGAGALAVPPPQPGGGGPHRVLGARYVSTVSQAVTWLLETQ